MKQDDIGNNAGDGRWRSLAARARQTPSEVHSLPPGFVERVLDGVPGRAVLVRSQGAERVVAVAAGLALAASLLVAAWCWNDIEAVLAAGPASLEQIVQLEPGP